METSKERFSPLAKQTWVVSAILLQMMGDGMAMGITSSMLPALLAPDSPIKISLEQASWISAVLGVGSIVTYIVSIFFFATYGRRVAILIGLVPAIAGPLICYFVNNVNAIIFGRFVSGMGYGIGLFGAIIIGEYTSPEYRGVFLNFKSEAVFFGCMVVHILNNYLHWRTVMLLTSVPFIANFAMVFTWPESPAWLASKKRYNQCAKSFYWMRGENEKSSRELAAMISAQKEQLYDLDLTILNSIIQFLKKFKKNNFLKPLGVYLFASILLEFTGRHVFPAYALQIVHELDPDNSKAFYYTLCLDVLINVGAVISLFLVKLMKRRTLLFTSGVLSVTILLLVCVYFFLRSKSLISSTYDSIGLVLFGLYFVIANAGPTPIGLTLIGELFPLEHRPTATGVAGILVSTSMIITLKIAPILLSSIHFSGTFAVFGVTMAICLVVLYITLPETKDKTLQEIEKYFKDNEIKHAKSDEETTLAKLENCSQ